ncbi:MAG TPA: DnaJ domain-containing protein [Brumimicrobium sp.]|nr:DnaJ domain-containing protein [Brumimicrobium sp.]
MNFLIVLVLVCFVVLFQVLGNIINDRAWDHNLIKNDHPTNEIPPHDRLLEAYISLGALMVRKDRSSYREKILYLNSYFSKHFPLSHYDFGRSFTESLKNPIQPRVISKWLRRKLPLREQRLQIMYFLAGLSNVDGAMNKREIALLKDINNLLKLSTEDFDSIIAMYTQKQERTKPSDNSSSRIAAIELAFRVMGVSKNASMGEIKKAYRRLVKLHHPDVFAAQGAEHQEIAEKRFIEIQKAYEILETRWK